MPEPSTQPAAADTGAGPRNWLGRAISGLEDVAVTVLLVLLAALPVLEVVLRLVFGGGLAANSFYLPHLTLWVALLGGVVTTRQGSHLSLSSGLHKIGEPWGNRVRAAASFLSVMVTTALAISALSLLLLAFEPGVRTGGIPVRLAVAIMPLGFAWMAARFLSSAPVTGRARLVIALAVPLGALLAIAPLVNALSELAPQAAIGYGLVQAVVAAAGAARVPLALLLVGSAFVGTPIFVILGGFTLLQFLGGGGSLELVADEAYAMLSQPLVPALPLFTFAGFILSESKAGERLIAVFRAWFGWFRGGLAVMAVLICAFFTTFTGASGVTILALGGLLLYMLVQNGYREKFSMGLLTASGSIGLLFPPALPIIMYGVIAQIDIRQLFVGGFVPGVVMVLALAGFGVAQAWRQRAAGAPATAGGATAAAAAEPVTTASPAGAATPPAAAHPRFALRPALLAVRGAAWELALPVVVIGLYFGGFTTLVETAAVATVYVLLVEMVVYREITVRNLPRVLSRCVPIIGGVLVILALAKGLSYLLIDAEIPTRLVEWFRAAVSSRLVFLILLNLTLLLAGALMDIFSAIVVLGPLLIPLGLSYGIHPVHLGIVFLANLELGYLTPPVGINLFLASYRFERDLTTVYRTVVPFLLLLLGAVLVITYVPALTTGLLGVFRF